MRPSKRESYFDRVIREYVYKDVECVLYARFTRAGPLLAVLINGLNAVAGSVYGFPDKDNMETTKKESKNIEKFLTKKMGLNIKSRELLGEVFYKVIRCGVAHEAVTKPGVHFFVNYDRQSDDPFLYRRDYDIWLNVAQFALKFLSVLDNLSASDCKFVPETDNELIGLVQELSEELEQLPDELANFLDGGLEEAYEKRSRSSSSPLDNSDTDGEKSPFEDLLDDESLTDL